eukprot:scaffold8867_cov118-Isochrysis_galbana.AAC.3
MQVRHASIASSAFITWTRGHVYLVNHKGSSMVDRAADATEERTDSTNVLLLGKTNCPSHGGRLIEA